MGRNHIHFCTGLSGSGADSANSTMRKSADVAIFVDGASAITAGIKFFQSRNGVVLTKGEQGTFPTRLFTRVEWLGNPRALLYNKQNGDLTESASTKNCGLQWAIQQAQQAQENGGGRQAHNNQKARAQHRRQRVHSAPPVIAPSGEDPITGAASSPPDGEASKDSHCRSTFPTLQLKAKTRSRSAPEDLDRFAQKTRPQQPVPETLCSSTTSNSSSNSRPTQAPVLAALKTETAPLGLAALPMPLPPPLSRRGVEGSSAMRLEDEEQSAAMHRNDDRENSPASSQKDSRRRRRRASSI